MLIITRKRGEGLLIGRSIRITVLEVVEGEDGTGPDIKIGIEAPKSIAVSRDDFTVESHLRRQKQRETDRGDKRSERKESDDGR